MKINQMMGYSAVLLVSIIFGCSWVGPSNTEPLFSASGTTTTIILVRHAERDDSSNASALTPKGQQRAKDLVMALEDMGVTAIYSPKRDRNRETAQPLADHLGLKIKFVEEAQLSNTRKFADTFVRQVLAEHSGGVVVWIGNRSPVGIWGGNLKEIYRRLGAEGNGPTRYSDLYIVTVSDKAPVHVHKTAYGAVAGRFDE